MVSIVAAVFITMIGVGVKSRGREASDVEAVVDRATFQATMTSLMNIVMAYCESTSSKRVSEGVLIIVPVHSWECCLFWLHL